MSGNNKFLIIPYNLYYLQRIFVPYGSLTIILNQIRRGINFLFVLFFHILYIFLMVSRILIMRIY